MAAAPFVPFFVFQQSIFIRGFGLGVPKDADEDDEHEWPRRAPFPTTYQPTPSPRACSRHSKTEITAMAAASAIERRWGE